LERVWGVGFLALLYLTRINYTVLKRVLTKMVNELFQQITAFGLQTSITEKGIKSYL
jgi:hypothetical protein